MHTINCKKLLMLKPTQIRIPNDRARKSTDDKALKVLSDSIAVNGVIEPIAVRRGRDGEYLLVAGQRRLKGAVMAGLRRVPCVVYDIDAPTAALYSLTENLQRSALLYFEEARALQRLITYYGFSRTEIALRLGLSQAELSYKLQLLDLGDELIEIITDNNFKEEYARLLLLLPEYQRRECLYVIINESLDFDKACALIEERLNPKPFEEKTEEPPAKETVTKPVRKHAIADTRIFANSLQKLTDTLKGAGMSVSLKRIENDKYTEYKVRIKKENSENEEFRQLKIC